MNRSKERNEGDPAPDWSWHERIKLVEFGLRSAVLFHPTIEGLIAAFAFGYVLPKHGVFWHGNMGRDQILIIDDDHLSKLLAKGSDQEIDDDTHRVVRKKGAGIRVLHSPKGYCLACLAKMRNIGLVDLMLVVAPNGYILDFGAQKLANTNVRVLY